jgi:hypothetical protein
MTILQNQHRDYLLARAREIINGEIDKCPTVASADEKFMLDDVRSNKVQDSEILQNDIVLDLNCLERHKADITNKFVLAATQYLLKLGNNTNKYLKEFGDNPTAHLILLVSSNMTEDGIMARLNELNIKYKRVADKKILIANVTSEEVKKIAADEMLKNYVEICDRISSSIVKRDTRVPGIFDWVGELFSKITENLILLIVSIFLAILLIVCAPALIQPKVEDIKIAEL